jgi:hypothetical protein
MHKALPEITAMTEPEKEHRPSSVAQRGAPATVTFLEPATDPVLLKYFP